MAMGGAGEAKAREKVQNGSPRIVVVAGLDPAIHPAARVNG
jgi:hypothetical protein